MNYILFFFLFSLFICCPNSCSQHGTCGQDDTCTCFPGFTAGDCSLRICPFDISFISNITEEEEFYSECSHQGLCNRQTGLCKCFDGFEGTACQRTICPNKCSGHGTCTSTKFVDVAHAEKYYLKYYNEEKVGALSDFVCVCDSLYGGADCSIRKCPMGYFTASDCETGSGPQVITIDPADETNNLAYALFRDLFGNEWYTQAFNVTSEDAWLEQLRLLPPNLLDIADVKVIAEGESKTKIEIYFGQTTTGKQHPIKIITNQVLKDTYPLSVFPGGYHGMTEIEEGALVEKTIIYQPDYTRPTTECSTNGDCITSSGLCNCFKGFYGPACEQYNGVI